MGVKLKSKMTLSCASANSRRLILTGRRRFSVKVACGSSMSHKCSGKFGSQLLIPETKRSLNVLMDHLAALVRCRWGGAS